VTVKPFVIVFSGETLERFGWIKAALAGRPVRLNAVSYYATQRGLLVGGAHRQLAPSNACGKCAAGS
jgi:hypothetical protein